jgi:hypothetical protein
MRVGSCNKHIDRFQDLKYQISRKSKMNYDNDEGYCKKYLSVWLCLFRPLGNNKYIDFIKRKHFADRGHFVAARASMLSAISINLISKCLNCSGLALTFFFQTHAGKAGGSCRPLRLRAFFQLNRQETEVSSFWFPHWYSELIHYTSAHWRC